MYEGIIREAASDREWIRHESAETLPEEETITGESKTKDCVRRNLLKYVKVSVSNVSINVSMLK